MNKNTQQGYPSQQFKNQINNLSKANQNIQQRKNISDSMVNLNKTLNEINPLLKKQESYIKNFFSQQNNTSAKQKQSSTRRYLNRICDIILQQMDGLFQAGQRYFTIDFKTTWPKIIKKFEKDLNDLKEEIDQNNMIDFLFKINNLKDYMMSLFIKSLIYRKCLLFKDLNIIQSGFVHSLKKKVSKQIEDSVVQKGFIPTRPHFQWPGFQINGYWSLNKMNNSQVDLKDLLIIADEEIQQILKVVRNFTNLNAQQIEHEDIKRNVINVKSLREQIQHVRYQYAQLQKKYQQASSRDQKSSDTVELREQVNKLTQALQQKQIELRNLKSESSNTFAQINSLNTKIKQLESDVHRLTNVELKKLKEVQMIQKSLNDQFARIHKNTSNFGAMFEFQSYGKQSLAQQIMKKQKTIEKMIDILGRQKKKTRNYQQQITRLNLIILELGDKLDQAKSSDSN